MKWCDRISKMEVILRTKYIPGNQEVRKRGWRWKNTHCANLFEHITNEFFLWSLSDTRLKKIRFENTRMLEIVTAMNYMG